MTKELLYMRLDAIKLALDSSATLLGQASTMYNGTSALSDANIKSVNTTIHVAEKLLRDTLNEELEGNDQEEDD